MGNKKIGSHNSYYLTPDTKINNHTRVDASNENVCGGNKKPKM